MNKAQQKRQQDLDWLHLLRPIDDDFMRCLLKDNIPLTELVLRIITDKPDLIITKSRTQEDMNGLPGARSICLNAYGTDAAGKKYSMEIQQERKGASRHRARYRSSVLDMENLDAGQDFDQLPDTYTIFIIERDFFGKGEPLYCIQRMNLTTDEPFDDGKHILYVNGEYRGNTDIGKLMHDFNCAHADDMYFELMAERTRFLKENPEGVGQMCKIIEDIRKEEREEGIKEGLRTAALRMLVDGTLALEKIAEYAGLPLDEVKNLKTRQGD